MKILMQQSSMSKDISVSKFDIAFIGEVIDERTKVAIDFIKQNTVEEIISIKYCPEEFLLKVNENKINADDWVNKFAIYKNKKIFVDATSIGFVELLMVISASFKNGGEGLSILYVEPDQYIKKSTNSLLQNRANFGLSEEILGYFPLPNFTGIISDTFEIIPKIVFFNGYESSRLQRVFEDIPSIKPENCTLVFGVPAFKPGWEINTFANNINIIKEKGLADRIKFSGASNPLSTYITLEKAFKSKLENEFFFIAPIGTKPQGVGAAIFASLNEDIGILYDHPLKSQGRTNSVGAWHLYQVDFNNN